LRGVLIAIVWTLAVNTLAVIVGPAHARAEIATWYGSENGPHTSSGERFDPDGACAGYALHSCTCAHRSYPFNTSLKVSWRGRTVVCRVTDRGPNIKTGADLDLSRSGARALRMIVAGRVRVLIAKVRIERVRRME
jgi:rare lipoprotein A